MQTDLRITYEDKELLTTVAFIALGLGETRVLLPSDDDPLLFIFEFISQEDGKTTFSAAADNKTTLRLKLANWNTPLPATLQAPMEIGTIRNRQALLVFSVQKIGALGELRYVIASLYMGKEVSLGNS